MLLCKLSKCETQKMCLVYFFKRHIVAVTILNSNSIIPVVDGTSKEVTSEKQETWSSWALVIFLGIALTLLIIGIAIGLLAKMNSSSASQARRQRAAAAAAAASANRHSAQIAASKVKMDEGNGNNYNADTLLSRAFDSPQDTLPDRSPDVIPHFAPNGSKPITPQRIRNFLFSLPVLVVQIM